MAGSDLATAGRLGLSMLGLQASIGALNDLVDAPRDAGQKPGKPIPRGVVTRRQAAVVAAVAGAAGVTLSAPSGAATVVAALVVLALGYAYDLRLSRTSLSWLPLALALPVSPIHAWLGATGSVPAGLVTLVPVAVLAGAALALGNGLVDVERDLATGRGGVVAMLGPRAAWLVQSAVLAVVVVLALSLAPAPAMASGPLALLRSAGVPLGSAAIALGVVVLRAPAAAIRERGWELEALGVAVAGVAWLAGTAATATGV